MPKSTRFIFSSLIVVSTTSLSAFAGWQDVSKINKWFDDQKNKKYNVQQAAPIQNAPGKLQTPGAIQTPGKLQIPRGFKAIKQSDATKCEHRYVVGADALFDFDKAFLNPFAEETLKVWGPLILKEGKHPISIEGHTDSIGGVEYNQELSEKRAHAVEFWLTDNKFLPAPATISGYGKSRPVAPNAKPDGSDNPTGRQLNRRVEIIVDRCKTVVTTATPSAAETTTTTTTTSPPAAETTTTTASPDTKVTTEQSPSEAKPAAQSQSHP